MDKRAQNNQEYKGLTNKENADLLWDFADDVSRVFSNAVEKTEFLDRMAVKKLYRHALECIGKAEAYFFAMHTQEGVSTARTLALLRRRLIPVVDEYISNLLSLDRIGYIVCRDLEGAVTDFNDDLQRLAVAFEYPMPPQTYGSIPTTTRPEFRVIFPTRKALEGKDALIVKNAAMEKITDEMSFEGEMYIINFCEKYEVPRTTAQYWLKSNDVTQRRCPDTGAVIISVPTLIRHFIHWKNKASKKTRKSPV